MNYFSEELERQLEAKKMSQVELSNATGISQSQISKWTRGDQTSINEEQLSSIANALSKSAVDHAQLIHAHLMDEKFGPGSELIRIEIDSPSELKDRPRSRSKGERAIHFLADLRKSNRATNNLVIDLAQCLGAEL